LNFAPDVGVTVRSLLYLRVPSVARNTRNPVTVGG
jgi:hypothetical protein